jgi:hypothetical protein
MSMCKPTNRGLLISLLLLLSSCGGGGMTPVSNSTLGGFWTGTLKINGVNYTAYAMSTETGQLALLETDTTSGFGAQYWGTISATGDQLSGSVSGAVLNQAVPFSDGSFRGTGTASGTIHQRSSIMATVAFTTALGTAISGQLALTYDSSYEQASSLMTISGNYTNIKTPGTDVLSISTAGDVTYADPLTTQCMATGTVTVLNASYSVYGGQITFSNCNNAYMYLNGVSIQGLGSVDPGTTPKPLLFLMHGMVSGLDTPFALAFQGT